MKRSFLTVLICISALILTVLTVFVGVGLYKIQNEPAFKDVTVELGTQSLHIEDFLINPSSKLDAAFVSDVRLIDLGQVGTTAITLRKGQNTQTVNLTVQDTTPPKLELVNTYTAALGYIPTPDDFVVAFSDQTEVSIQFDQAPQAAQDYSDQTITLTATDLYGNTTTGQAVLRFDWIREEVTVELGTPLTKADILLDPEKDDSLITQEAINEINMGGIGKYSLPVRSGSSERICSITVQDTLPPALEIQEISIYPDQTCTMEDFIISATDASGDVKLEMLTQLRFGEEGDFPVKIKATDKNGLSVTAETTLRIHKDITPPEIYGMWGITVKANAEMPNWDDRVYAVDYIDGNVKYTYDASDVDLTRAGIYYVVYTAKDSTGNIATRQRKVTVQPDYADTEQLVKDIVATIDGTDPESLRDFVRNNIRYVSHYGGKDPVSFGFTNWYGNCYVHALCLKALFDYYGYENELIWVIGKTHYWNLIKIDGTWYHIDSTPGTVHTRYSLMDNKKRLSTLGGRRWDTSLWPQMNEETKEDDKK